jgi:hypothetical protein
MVSNGTPTTAAARRASTATGPQSTVPCCGAGPGGWQTTRLTCEHGGKNDRTAVCAAVPAGRRLGSAVGGAISHRWPSGATAVAPDLAVARAPLAQTRAGRRPHRPTLAAAAPPPPQSGRCHATKTAAAAAPPTPRTAPGRPRTPQDGAGATGPVPMRLVPPTVGPRTRWLPPARLSRGTAPHPGAGQGRGGGRE